MRRLLPVLLCLTVLAPAVTFAVEDDLVDRAFANMQSERTQEWAFTETTKMRGKTIVKTYDPKRPPGERWKLESVNGRTPTPEEYRRIERRNEREAERQSESAESEDKNEVSAMISPGSLTLIEEDDRRAIYSFRPDARRERERKMFEHVDGRLEIDKQGPIVSAIKLDSRGPFSAGFGVKIRQFKTHMTFAPIEDGGPAFPQSVDVKLQGKAFMFKKLDEDSRVTYSDWKRIAP